MAGTLDDRHDARHPTARLAKVVEGAMASVSIPAGVELRAYGGRARTVFDRDGRSHRRTLRGMAVRTLGWGPSLHHEVIDVVVDPDLPEAGLDPFESEAARDPAGLHGRIATALERGMEVQRRRAGRASSILGTKATEPFDPGQRWKGRWSRLAEIRHLLIDRSVLDEIACQADGLAALAIDITEQLSRRRTGGRSSVLQGDRVDRVVALHGPADKRIWIGRAQLRIDMALPETVVLAMPGRRVGEVFELPRHHEALGTRRVVGAHFANGTTVLDIEAMNVRIREHHESGSDSHERG